MLGTVNQQHLVDHGNEMGIRREMQLPGDALGDEVGVGGGPADDDSQGDDGIRPSGGATAERFHRDGDLIGAGHPEDLDGGLRHQLGQFALCR